MRARRAAVAGTRQRIVDAAVALHSEKGILATNWAEISELARVAPATVYRHFPSLVELIPACARSVFDVMRPPTAEEAAAKFAHLGGPWSRLEWFIRESCHCYADGEAWLHAARRERGLIPAVDQVVTVQEQSVGVLVRACLAEAKVGPEAFRTLCALTDFPFWKSLIDRAMSRQAALRTVLRLAKHVLQGEGIDTEEET